MIPLSFLKLDQVYWIAIAALGILLGVQTVRVASLKVDVAKERTNVAQEKAGRAAETAARATAASEHGKAISKLEHDHALAQQKQESENAEKFKELEDRRAADKRTVGSLQSQLAAYTAGGRRPGETDAAALERYQHRLDVVGGLLGEGFDLLAEGRGRLERRDQEVALLLAQIKIDRAACEAVPAPKP